jgi:hypothetical protein
MMPKFEYILCCSLLYTYYVLHQPPPTERNKPEREIQTNRKNTRKDNFEKKRRRYRPRKKREEEIQSNCLIWCFLFGLFVVCFSNFKHTLNKKQLCIREYLVLSCWESHYITHSSCTEKNCWSKDLLAGSNCTIDIWPVDTHRPV